MNFSNSNIWIDSLYIRYPIDKIVKIGAMYFYNDNDLLICQNFFQPSINEQDIEALIQVVNKGVKVRFSYIDNSEILDTLQKMASDNRFIYDEEGNRLVSDNKGLQNTTANSYIYFDML